MTDTKPTNELIKEIHRQIDAGRISQTELAEDWGISPALISLIMNELHRAEISLFHLKRIIRNPKFDAHRLLEIICRWAGMMPVPLPKGIDRSGEMTVAVGELLIKRGRAMADGSLSVREVEELCRGAERVAAITRGYVNELLGGSGQ